MGSKGTNTTTQQATPNAGVMASYQELMDRASGVANTPYQAYSGNLTAGINQQQNLGIGNINTASQAGSPWFDYASSMAHPVSQSDIERYQNPYTQHVVDATQAQFDRVNAQQQEGLKAREISQGALGGSRARIAAADMGYQQQLGQAPVIAGLYNQSYNQALTAAQQQQQAGFQGAGVGANIQQAGLQGAGAQIGAGTLQQQAEQAALSAQYGQYQQAQAFPYQQTQWLAGVDTGVGSQMGGTSTTTAPAPSVFGQLAGLATAGAGAYLGAKAGSWRGGGVGYDAGGSVGSEPYGGVGWIPHMKIAGGPGAPRPPGMPEQKKPALDPSKFAFPKSGVGNYQGDFSEGLPGGADFGGEAAPLGGMSPEGGSVMGGLEGVGAGIMSALPEGVAAALPFLLLNRGGAVRGYADGGPASLDERWGDMSTAPGESPLQLVGTQIADKFLHARPSIFSRPIAWPWEGNSDVARSVGVSALRERMRPGYADGGAPEPYYPYGDTDQAYDEDAPPMAGVGASGPAEGWGGLAQTVSGLQNGPSPYYQPRMRFPGAEAPSTVGVGAGPAAAPARNALPAANTAPYYDDAPAAGVGAPPSSRSGGFDWSSLSMPLMAAGLGMMASRSPHPGVAIGEGGLAGVQAYAEQKRQTAEQGLAEKKQALDARRLQQMADQSREHLKLQTRTQDFHEKQADRPYTEQTAQQKAELDMQGRRLDHAEKQQLALLEQRARANDIREKSLDRESLRPTGAMTEDNHPILYDSRRPGVAIDGVTGDPLKPGQKVINPKNDVGASIPEEHKDLHGEDYAATLPAGESGFVKGLAEYAIDPKTLSTRGGQRERYLKMALQYDPNFRQQRYNEIYNAVNRFSTGKQGDTVKSFNVAIHHLGTLEEAAKALNNRDIPGFNRVANVITNQLGYDSVNSFEAVRDIVGNEMVKAIIGSGGGVGDREEAHKRISAANSPAQLTSVIGYYKKLMAGQMLGLKKQYEDSTGLHNFDSKLMPATIEQLGIASGHGAAAAAARPAAPAPDQNAAAREWLAKNPNDPRAAAMRQKLGIQ